MQDLTRASAGRIVRAVRGGEVSAVEVAEAHLRAVEQVDPDLAAFVSVDADRVLDQAAGVDAARAAGRPLGPLAGVPISVKDNVDVAGEVTACCSAAHDGVPAAHDAPAVARLREAGAVLLGRTNMDELAMGASTQTSVARPSRNPHDRRRSPGGSSGGAAVSVAAGMTTLAVGTDTGGSVREPASQCGIVGMAPSPGLVPLDGVVPFAPRLDRVGPLGRSVGDVRRLLHVLAASPTPAELPTRRDEPLRVGIVDELSGRVNQDGVLACFDGVLDALADLGTDVVRVLVPEGPRGLAAYMSLTSAACVPVLEPWVATGRAGEEVARRVAIGRELLTTGEGQDELDRAEHVRRRLRLAVARALQTCDVLLCPTMPTTAPLLFGELTPEDLADPMAAPYTDCWTVVANLVGVPALSVPAGFSVADGMPVGVMLMGAAGSDATLLALGERLELALGLPR